MVIARSVDRAPLRIAHFLSHFQISLSFMSVLSLISGQSGRYSTSREAREDRERNGLQGGHPASSRQWLQCVGGTAPPAHRTRTRLTRSCCEMKSTSLEYEAKTYLTSLESEAKTYWTSLESEAETYWTSLESEAETYWRSLESGAKTYSTNAARTPQRR